MAVEFCCSSLEFNQERMSAERLWNVLGLTLAKARAGGHSRGYQSASARFWLERNADANQVFARYFPVQMFTKM